ncbi:MAG: alpha/beta hydrolase [Betaproteobacteria bacterium]
MSDLRAAARLATSATLGTTRIIDGVHQSVWRSMGVPGGQPPDRPRGLTGLVYRCVGGIAQAVGLGIDAALARLEPLFGSIDATAPESPQRLAVLAALNGVIGDRLLADGNPLALPMTLQLNGRVLDPAALPPASDVGGKILLLVHGLCMNDLQWQTWRKAADGPLEPGLDHGRALALAQGFTPLYLRYNSGRHVSDNGHDLSALLQRLLAAWPVPVRELVVVAHSMGGLVARSAVHQARQRGQDWADRLSHIVFLGTPHHGAPLERAGNWVDQLLGSTPWSAPFARLARLRSCGITDLRHGNLVEEDWSGRDRFQRHADTRNHVPLPAGITCLAVAATLAGQRSVVAERLLGDGLVPLRSALGQHDDPTRSLAFGPHDQAIAYRTGHMQLLSDPDVGRTVGDWLAHSRAVAPGY